jgi:hypothetical protein
MLDILGATERQKALWPTLAKDFDIKNLFYSNAV